ncbi:putative Ig domain-containing protein [Comamonas avium]|uniref:putative Ig domain-containing protein n=1 Tax=Comamonas avium TaxID=2762231 RepID=UPI001CD8F4D6|nr:putative Ig domain-containing protein [Comamonas avium]
MRGWLHAFWRKGLLILSLLLCSSYVHAQGAPTVAGVGPNSGSTTGGDSVILTGTNFTGATAVRFGEKSATGFSVNNATTITATTPTHAAGAVTVEVTTPGGSAALTNAYTYVLPAPAVGQVSATVAANSSSNPITLSLSGGAATSVAVVSSPAHGIALASGTSIRYTPAAGYSGSDSFIYTATGAGGTSAAATVTITVSAPPLTITPTTLPNGTQSTAYSQTLTTSAGTVPYSYRITSGSLPAGLSLDISSGVISGTPTAGGTYNFSIGVQDRYSATGSQAYSLTVSAPSITLSPGSLSNGTVGVTYNSSFSASGGTAPYSYSITSGSLPTGLSLNNSTGTLSGTPTAGGTFNLTITASDTNGATGSQTYSLTVSAPSITLSPGSLINGTVGTPYSATLSSTGGTAPYSYSITSGSLPTGLSLNTGTGAISGIPSVAGAYNLTITATDTNSATGSQAYSITIGGQVPVSTAVIAVVPANSSLNPITLNISGGAATSVAVASAASHGTATASGTSISYTPAAGFSGADSFTYTATNASGTSSPATVSITVSAPTLTITPTTLPNGTQSTAYSQTLTTSAGTAPYSYRITSGNLPAGLSLNTSSGVFSGTPTAGGAFNLTITVTDANGATGSQPYSLQVQAQSVVVPPSNQTVAAGQTASVDLTQGATGGPFTSATLLSVSPPSAGTARMTGPFTMSFAPAAAFSGSAVVSFNLQAASGSVGNGFVTFAVQSRPDPTTDATVRGVTTSQQQAAVRFAGTQLMNFTQRLEHLRTPQRSTFTNGLQLAMPRAVNTQVRNCRSATSLLEQQECVSSQGRMERGSLAPGWSRAAQHNAAAAAQGMNTEQAFASRPQPLGQDVPLSEVGSASGTQRSVTASQQFMGKIAPEHAQMTALPAADTPIAEPGSAARPRLAYWTSGMVDWGFADATAGQDDGLRFTTSGVTMGMDYLLSKEWTVGMGIGFAYDRTKIGSEGSRNHSKGVSTALYGSWNPAPAYFVDGVLGYSRMSFDTRRWVADAGEFAQGERDGSQWFAALSAGYEWRTEHWMLSPYGRLQFARSSLDAYTETGAGWHALRFEKQSITNTSASLGLRGEISHDTRWGTLLPFGRLELQHDFDHQSNMRLGYADLAGSSQSYSISSTALGRNRVQLGFGSRLQSRVGTFAAEMQFTRSSHSFQRGLRLMYTTRW